MERLPYIDEHAVEVDAAREEAWSALIGVVRGSFAGEGRRLGARALGCHPADTRGEWADGPRVGASLPGFCVAESTAPARLALEGRHRFSTYALIFELDAVDVGRSRVRAITRADFPGPLGRLYRALVVGSRGHRIVVRRMLAQIAARA